MLGIHNSIFASIDSNVIFTTAIIVGCGIVNQFFGMATEKAAFSCWNKKYCNHWNMDNAKCPPESNSNENFCKHVYWQYRYEIMCLYFKSNDTDERMIAQFFMAHNVSIGFSIPLIWVLSYSFTHVLHTSTYYDILSIGILALFTAFSFVVSLIRFRTVVRFLYTFAKVNEIPCCDIKNHFENLIIKNPTYKIKNATADQGNQRGDNPKDATASQT